MIAASAMRGCSGWGSESEGDLGEGRVLGTVVRVQKAAPVRGPHEMRELLGGAQVVVLVIVNREAIGGAGAESPREGKNQEYGDQFEGKFETGHIAS